MATVATVATVPLSRLVDWMSGIEGPAAIIGTLEKF